MGIYTSRFTNRNLVESEALKVGICRGLPKFKLKYELSGNITALAPPSYIFRMTDKEAFKRKYIEHLEAIGIGRVQAMLDEIRKDEEKDMVLLCYEDITCPDDSKNWCHRNMFAEWYQSKTGCEIKEYPDNGTYAAKQKPKEEDQFDQISLF